MGVTLSFIVYPFSPETRTVYVKDGNYFDSDTGRIVHPMGYELSDTGTLHISTLARNPRESGPFTSYTWTPTPYWYYTTIATAVLLMISLIIRATLIILK